MSKPSRFILNSDYSQIVSKEVAVARVVIPNSFSVNSKDDEFTISGKVKIPVKNATMVRTLVTTDKYDYAITGADFDIQLPAKNEFYDSILAVFRTKKVGDELITSCTFGYYPAYGGYSCDGVGQIVTIKYQFCIDPLEN